MDLIDNGYSPSKNVLNALTTAIIEDEMRKGNQNQDLTTEDVEHHFEGIGEEIAKHDPSVAKKPNLIKELIRAKVKKYIMKKQKKELAKNIYWAMSKLK